MDKMIISIGDFLKNAGIVGLKYLLDESDDADEESDYGISDDGQSIWLDREFVKNADWTDMYFKSFVKQYGPLTVYQAVLDRIEDILEKSRNENWNKADCKSDLRFINDKLLSNSYKSGFATIKQDIERPEVYEQLNVSKLKDSMESEELCMRLRQLKDFLEQPLCEETFSMKSIIYEYIKHFWDGKSFLHKDNASKNMREVFEADFSEPLRLYASAGHKKSKDMCIDCGSPINSKEKVSIAFMKDQADDLSRKRSAFWNCKVDAWLCPVCAFVYSLVPLGFTLVGRTFVFINMNKDITAILKANPSDGRLAGDSEREENERYPSWIARTIDMMLQEKSRELGNIQVITRGMDENDRYTFDVVSKDVLTLLSDDIIQKRLNSLSISPYIKNGNEYQNIHETVILNILRYQNQYPLINKLLRAAIDTGGILPKAGLTYDIQARTNLLRKNEIYTKTGGELMGRYYALRNEGYELRKTLLEVKGTNDDACIRGTIYQLLNALSVGNVEHFMEIIMRIYCSTKLQVPDIFIEFLKDKNTFMEYGYAFLLGLQGSHYEKKEEVTNG